jgi:hypothetical protein
VTLEQDIFAVRSCLRKQQQDRAIKPGDWYAAEGMPAFERILAALDQHIAVESTLVDVASTLVDLATGNVDEF